MDDPIHFPSFFFFPRPTHTTRLLPSNADVLAREFLFLFRTHSSLVWRTTSTNLPSSTVTRRLSKSWQTRSTTTSIPEAKKSPLTIKTLAPPSDMNKPKVYRLFGRDRPVHHVLGGGMPVDVLLWRNKKLSAGALGVATIIWVLFELLEYHLLTLVCHGLIPSLAILFLWSNGTTFINKKPPHFPEVSIAEQPVLEFISMLRFEINHSLALLREIASGGDLKKFIFFFFLIIKKKFILVISGLWVMSKVGSWCNLLTLVYLVFVILHSVPVLYEKHEDKVDPLAEKAMIEMKKHYAVMDAKVLSKTL